MKIGVVGCGALGAFYGAKLCRAGHDVHFLLRSDYDAVKRGGVKIESVAGDFSAVPHAARMPEEIGDCDLVLIGLKATANDQFGVLLPPLVGPRTMLLTLQNGLGNEEALARHFSPDQILGGLAFVCLNRIAPGHIRHMAHGHIVIGEFQRSPQPRTRELAEMFQHAGVPCQVRQDLELAHWEKLVWNIPFNGLGVASAAGYDALCKGNLSPGTPLQPCLTTDLLLDDPRWHQWLKDLMNEVIAAATGLGMPLSPELVEVNLNRTRSMGPYKASTLLDFEQRKPLELESLFLKPLRAASAAGVPTPRLKALCAILTQLDPARS